MDADFRSDTAMDIRIARLCEGNSFASPDWRSGSSEYAGDCVRLPLQRELGIVAQAIGGSAILAHGDTSLPPAGRG